ncbi:ABC transporter substrate-binding protein [Mumia sp. zg.B17]|uniref:ABC transporter substrate-binding protein n=1 Tax=Mumia sp. zg.B17 TaxID=2855446 RepID=UPI001C6ECC07|nr:ABC transporter substrate-binding protein [Mumia sp. zg.B17]MBW9205799.1 ABC transporter substrate-binding protein [Mumia sp. zg.B17]
MHRSPTPRAPRPLRLLAVVAAVMLALTACGGDDSSAGEDGTTAVTVGVIPIVDVAPIYLGIDQGFFEDEGLDLTLKTAQGGAAIVPGVVSDEFQFGFSNTISLLLANTQGLPLEVVSAGVSSTGEAGKDFGAVIVSKDSNIQTAADLAGKKVAVNTLKNINTTTINEAVRQDGGDPSSIDYIELPFPDIAAAVSKGTVDAGQVVEPFLTITTRQGDRQVVSNYAATDPNLEVGMYFASKGYAEKNPEVVKKFRTAMEKSLEYAQAHPDEVRTVLGTYTEIDPAIGKAVMLPRWSAEIDEDSVQKLADLAEQDELISKQPDLEEMLP